MSNYFPLINDSENAPESLAQSFNDVSLLSRILEIIYKEHNSYQYQLDFFRILYLIYESAVSSNKIQNINQLENRFLNRFKRKAPEKLINLVPERLSTYGYLTKSPEGYLITNSGMRIFSGLFGFIINMFTYHQKEDSIEQAVFLAELAGMEFKINKELGIENSTKFFQLVNALKNLTDEIRKNIIEYTHKKNALTEIDKLQKLIESIVKEIKETIATEVISDKIDDFRLKISDVDHVIEEAMVVAFKGFEEVIKTIKIASSQVVYSAISEQEFHQNLIAQLKKEFLRQEDIQSAYEISLKAEQETLFYLPNKTFGGIAEKDIWTVINNLDEGKDFGFETVSIQAASDEFNLEIEPQLLSFEEINDLEEKNTVINSNLYDEYMNSIYEQALYYSEQEKTIYDWINELCKTDDTYFFATVFLDFLSRLSKLGLLDINIDLCRKSFIKPKDWSFIKISKYPTISGCELIKIPHKVVLSEYEQAVKNYKKAEEGKVVNG